MTFFGWVYCRSSRNNFQLWIFYFTARQRISSSYKKTNKACKSGYGSRKTASITQSSQSRRVSGHNFYSSAHISNIFDLIFDEYRLRLPRTFSPFVDLSLILAPYLVVFIFDSRYSCGQCFEQSNTR